MKINNKPFLIAEISANHCGKIDLAKKLIHCAKINGADAVKIQTYTPETMTVNSIKKLFQIKEGLWKGYSLWDLYDEAHTPFHWHKDLFEYAKTLKIKLFSSPFDETAVDLLESLKCPIYKVASFEMTDLPLVKRIAETKKPMIISTGMANLYEIEKTFNVASQNGANDITLLYCVSKYPIEDFNLNNIKILKEKFNCKVGLSDHSKDERVGRAAVAVGAEVFEKHIALRNQKKGLDIDFSLKGREIRDFKNAIDETYNLLGKNFFHRVQNEKKSKIFRRSIFAVENIKKGEKFTKKNIRRIRPGNGLSPEFFEKLLGKKSPLNINKLTPLTNLLLKKLNIKYKA